MYRDPVAEAEAYYRNQEMHLAMLPTCHICKEPIQQDKAVYYNNKWCCEDCEYDFWSNIREDFLEKVEEE